MSRPISEQIETILAMSEAELLRQIGAEATAGEFGAGEMSDEEREESGRNWWMQSRERVTRVVCGSHLARIVLEGGKQWDSILLVAAIADLIAGSVTGVSPVAVAALIAKHGLEKLCKDNG